MKAGQVLVALNRLVQGPGKLRKPAKTARTSMGQQGETGFNATEPADESPLSDIKEVPR
jgi:hypothetical protein